MDVPDLTVRRALVERVAASQTFISAPKLRAFFLYVSDCSLRGQPEDATEQQIGVRVFSRAAGYNSGDDSIVRSQARLLRIKLSAYFSEEGKREPLLIEMPKGHYVPVFRDRASQSMDLHEPDWHESPAGRPSLAQDSESPPAILATPAVARIPAQLMDVRRILMLITALAVGFIAGAWSYRRWSTTEDRKPNPLWSSFFATTPPTLVIYSNPLFHGTPSTGLKLVDPASPSVDHQLDDETYTGTGEVAAIRQLTRFFDAHNADFILKRSRLVTWDEARSSNLIFVGAPSQNPALQDFPALSQFAIVVDPREHGSIVNRHPMPGEPSNFPTNDKTQETAIIALVPGLEARTHILVASGLTTIGTQTAVEYLCRPESVAALAQQAGTANREIRPFEAVLQIGISKGVGVSVRLILLHRH
jgi:hypothetical protein